MPIPYIFGGDDKARMTEDIKSTLRSDSTSSLISGPFFSPPPRANSRKNLAAGGASNTLGALLHRMNPRECIAGSVCVDPNTGMLDCGPTVGSISSGVSSSSSLEDIIPNLLGDITKNDPSNSKKRVAALKKLYSLTDKQHKQNRIPIVCTSNWDAISTLASCLDVDMEDCPFNESASPDSIFSSVIPSGTQTTPEDDIRRLACLTLNNLSIPNENKAMMALGSSSSKLLQSLLRVIQEGRVESYLCVICLMNLSYLEDAAGPVIFFSPSVAIEDDTERSRSGRRRRRTSNWSVLSPPTASGKVLPKALSENGSLLRTVERMMQLYSPFLMSRVLSVEGEAVRWSVGLIRNATKKEEHASLVARTDIPRLVVTFVRDSPHKISRWTEDSLEDLSLSVLFNLARWDDSRRVLRRCGAVAAVKPIMGQGGIHDFRAGVIWCSLEGC